MTLHPQAEDKPEEKQDIILSAVISADGKLSVTSPQDLRTAAYLMQILNVKVSSMFAAKINEGMQPKKTMLQRMGIVR